MNKMFYLGLSLMMMVKILIKMITILMANKISQEHWMLEII